MNCTSKFLKASKSCISPKFPWGRQENQPSGLGFEYVILGLDLDDVIGLYRTCEVRISGCVMMRGRSYSYSPSPPRGYYGRRYRSPSPRGRYGGRSRDLPTSLLVRNLRQDCRPEDLRGPFGRFGPLKDVYLPRDYYTGEPRGFGFVQYIDAADAADAKHHMDGEILLGRELTVVFAEENRKKPSEMRARERFILHLVVIVIIFLIGIGHMIEGDLQVLIPDRHDMDMDIPVLHVMNEVIIPLRLGDEVTIPLPLEEGIIQGRFRPEIVDTESDPTRGPLMVLGAGVQLGAGAGVGAEASSILCNCSAPFTILLLTIVAHFSISSAIRDGFFDLVSDGMDQNQNYKILELGGGGFSKSVTWSYISTGSNLFFEMFGTGIFGAGLFPILGIFPQLVLVLVTGLSASEDTVASVATMGMGILAGTTILNLTVVWSSIIAFGSYNLFEDSTSSDWESNISKPFSLTCSGVKTDKETKDTAKIMMLSMIPFLLILLSELINSPSAARILVLISLIITVILLISYCTYQVFQPWIQKRRLEYLMRQHLQKKLLPVLCNRDGSPSVAKISKLFNKLDRNKDAQISADELRSLILGVQIEEVGLREDDCVSHVMEEFDISGDSTLSKDEFIQGLSKWLTKANDQTVNNQVQNKAKFNRSNSQGTTEEQKSLMAKENQSKKDADKSPWWSYTKATVLILIGTALTILLGSPLLQTVKDFAAAVDLPSFLVSYFLIPFALTFRKALKAIISATEKTEKSVSLTLSEIYGAVFMNNVMGLVSFLVLVYVRDVAWDVSAEILMVLITCIGVGLAASFSTHFPIWTSIVFCTLYPLSLAFLYLLTAFWGLG
ncbi:hypothetical protein Tsubulata_035967 [Turnera subulata]|uniref:RRM domain-containing protein n=1 Tax=Turnera subulata TaxID=218843 RepID=A0A9Q0FBL8_9ROSI|nr:hypothetical protein Tsubulata_035967 [Turnera subulata]